MKVVLDSGIRRPNPEDRQRWFPEKWSWRQGWCLYTRPTGQPVLTIGIKGKSPGEGLSKKKLKWWVNLHASL